MDLPAATLLNKSQEYTTVLAPTFSRFVNSSYIPCMEGQGCKESRVFNSGKQQPGSWTLAPWVGAHMPELQPPLWRSSGTRPGGVCTQNLNNQSLYLQALTRHLCLVARFGLRVLSPSVGYPQTGVFRYGPKNCPTD